MRVNRRSDKSILNSGKGEVVSFMYEAPEVNGYGQTQSFSLLFKTFLVSVCRAVFGAPLPHPLPRGGWHRVEGAA